MRIALLLRLAFWSALVFAFVMAVIPQQEAMILSNDKSQHMLAFFTLAVLGRLAYPQVRLILIATGLVAVGALIELVQLIPALNRQGDWLDLAADVVALSVGLLITLATRRRAAD